MYGQINVLLYKDMDVGELNVKLFLSTAEWLISPLSKKSLDVSAFILQQQGIYGWDAE